MIARRTRPCRFGGTVVVVALWSLVGLTGCGATSGSGVSTTSSAAPQASGTTTATFPSTTNPVTIDAGTYRIPKSEWSVADVRVTFPKGWTVQYGHDYLKHPDGPDEFGFYAVAPDAIYDDACKGRGELERVGPSVGDLATALLRQPGLEVSGPVHTSLGGHPRHPDRPRCPARSRSEDVSLGGCWNPDLVQPACGQVLRASARWQGHCVHRRCRWPAPSVPNPIPV
jgi:hypothetical protein